MGIVYYIIDLETNGLKSNYHEVNEVSIIRCSDRVQLTEFIKCENPERSSVDALVITNKTLEDLNKGTTREKAVEKINAFLNEDNLSAPHRCFIGHNVSFDRRFIHALYESVSKVFEGDLWLDTMALTKQYAKSIGLVKPKVNLHAALDILQIKKFSEKHSSKIDSRNTYLLHKNLVEDKKVNYLPFIKTAIHSINDEEIDMSILSDD